MGGWIVRYSYLTKELNLWHHGEWRKEENYFTETRIGADAYAAFEGFGLPGFQLISIREDRLDEMIARMPKYSRWHGGDESARLTRRR